MRPRTGRADPDAAVNEAVGELFARLDAAETAHDGSACESRSPFRLLYPEVGEASWKERSSLDSISAHAIQPAGIHDPELSVAAEEAWADFLAISRETAGG